MNEKTNAEENEKNRFKAIEATYTKSKELLETEEAEINASYDRQKAKIQEVYDAKTRAAFESKEAALRFIDDEIAKLGDLQRAAEDAYAAATKAKQAQQNPITNLANWAYDLAGGKQYPQNFAGGPISGGTTSIVNELGKEAFLSASGRLSMINAPAFGKWTAPTSGTIIPAHLTKELDIPAGGINLNQPAGMSRRAASPATGGAVGDVFHQNVTVQAVNPVQAANNMMVEMTRMRRRRFG